MLVNAVVKCWNLGAIMTYMRDIISKFNFMVTILIYCNLAQMMYIVLQIVVNVKSDFKCVNSKKLSNRSLIEELCCLLNFVHNVTLVGKVMMHINIAYLQYCTLCHWLY
jgi:hypothetical protein